MTGAEGTGRSKDACLKGSKCGLDRVDAYTITAHFPVWTASIVTATHHPQARAEKQGQTKKRIFHLVRIVGTTGLVKVSGATLRSDLTPRLVDSDLGAVVPLAPFRGPTYAQLP